MDPNECLQRYLSSLPDSFRTTPHPDYRHDFNDEIDLLGLIKAVLATWKIWLLAVLAATTIFGASQLVGLLDRVESAPFSKAIAITFQGADQGVYPSGAPYRVQDIVAPAVLQSVYEDLTIADTGVSIADFQNSITIQPYTPYYREILAKYDSLLDPKNMDFDRIQALQQRKRAELENSLSSGAVLRFDPEAADLPEGTAREALRRIPVEWARQAISDKGALKTDIQLVSAQTLDQSLFENVDYVVLSDLFAEKADALQENIAKIQNLEGAATVRDPQTGWSLSDLEKNLHDLEVYKIDELMSPIRSLGLSRNPTLAAFYYEEKRELLQDRLARLEEESELIQSAFKSYSPDQSMASVSEGSQTLSGSYGMVPQLSGEMVDKLLQAGGEDSVEKYKQILNDRWLATNLKVAEVKAELRTIDRLIAAVKGEGGDSLTAELRDDYLERAESTVPVIVNRLRDFYEVSWRIYEQISRDRVGSAGYLYKDAHQGVLRASAMPNLPKMVLLYIALIAAVTFVVVPLVMIRNAMKTRSRAQIVAAE